jgi:hypothetical protein
MLVTSSVLSKVRNRISDAGSSQTFSDAELADYLSDVINQYSGFRPKHKTTKVMSVVGQNVYTLPTDCAWVDVVNTPNAFDLSFFYNAYGTWTFIQDIIVGDRALIDMRSDLISLYAQLGQPIWDNYGLDDNGNPQIIFYPAPADANIEWDITYSALHTTDSSGNYPSVPVQDINDILDLLEAKCLDVLATHFSKKGDYKVGQTSVNYDPEDLRKRSLILQAQVKDRLGDTSIGMRG